MSDLNRSWYLLELGKPQRWKAIKQVLSMSFGEENVWLPTQKVEIQHKKLGKVFRETPLYPNYIFLNLFGNTSETFKLESLEVGVKFLPGNIPEDEMKVSKEYAKDLGVKLYASELKIGSRLRIKSGPFSNFEGTLLSNDKGNCRLELVIFGRTMPLAINAENLDVK